jgi:hypothetical protein
MHEGQPYGYLKVNLMVIHAHNLSHMTGVNIEVVERLLKELLSAGVCSMDSAGCIYSRRMVRDEEIRKKRADGGILGGNPYLLKDNHKVNLINNLTPNLSTEDEEEDKEEDLIVKHNKLKKDKPKIELIFPCPEMEGIWLTWTAYKKAQHKEVYKTAQSAQIQVNNLWALADQNPVNALAIINHSMGNLWKGLIKPKTESNGANQQQHKPNPLASFNRFAEKAIEANRIISEGQGNGGDLFTEIYGQSSR